MYFEVPFCTPKPQYADIVLAAATGPEQLFAVTAKEFHFMSKNNVSPLNDSVAIRHEIEAAAQPNVAIRVHRVDIEDGYLNGFVTAVGQNLFVIELISDSIYLDGFVCLRLEDVSHVDRPAPCWEFLKEALLLRKQRHKDDLTIDCESVSTLLRSIPKSVGLVSVHSETVDPDVCFIGRIVNVGEDKLILDTVSPDAEWHTESMGFQLSDITQIGFGGAYEEALFQVVSSRKS